jgi:Na+/proline symporter
MNPNWAGIVSCFSTLLNLEHICTFSVVVWTDVFQIFMMFSGMIAIIIKGTINVGGPSKVFEIADAHGRIEFFK